jgi:hypothetical protein
MNETGRTVTVKYLGTYLPTRVVMTIENNIGKHFSCPNHPIAHREF